MAVSALNAPRKRAANVFSYIAVLFFVLGIVTALVSYGFFAWIGLAVGIASWRRKEPRAYIALVANAGLLLLNFVSVYLPPLLGWEYLFSYSYFAFFLVFLFLFLLLVVLLLYGLYQLTRCADFSCRRHPTFPRPSQVGSDESESLGELEFVSWLSAGHIMYDLFERRNDSSLISQCFWIHRSDSFRATSF